MLLGSARSDLPAHWHPTRPVFPEELPRAYLTVKSKCFHVPGGGLKCERQHAHEREIIAIFKSDCQSEMIILNLLLYMPFAKEASPCGKRASFKFPIGILPQNEICRTVDISHSLNTPFDSKIG